MLRPFFAASIFGLLVGGCTSDDNTKSPPPGEAFYPDATVDATTTSDAGEDAATTDADGSACVGVSASCADLSFPTGSVTYATSSGSLPLAAGGTILPGLYALVSQTTYGAAATTEAGAPTQASAFSLDACNFFTFTSFTSTGGAGSTSVTATVAGTYETAGTTLRLVEDCPSVEALTPLLYTATPTGLTLIEPADPLSGAPAAVSVFALQ